MKEIVLSRGMVAFVDDEDYERINNFKWHARKKGKTYYAVRNTSRSGGVKRQMIFMHKEILRTEIGFDTDHKNMNGLDNQKLNLRPCTKAQNQWNTPKRVNNTSGYKGIVQDKRDGTWIARISVSGVVKTLGYFKTPEEAAASYQAGSAKYHGEFSKEVQS